MGEVLKNARLWALLSVVALVVLYRWVPHVPNVTPVAALALFSGAFFSDRRLAFAVPMVALLISDALIGFYASMPFVYLAFALTVLLGRGLASRLSGINTVLSAFVGSILFFLITNFGAWAVGDLYPHSLSGLWQAYVAGVPFYRYTLMGDLFFSGVFFAAFLSAQHVFPQLQEKTA